MLQVPMTNRKEEVFIQVYNTFVNAKVGFLSSDPILSLGDGMAC